MSSQRKAIRQQAVSMLKSANIVGTRVFPTRVLSLWTNELPAICVYTLNDDPKIEITAPRTLMRALDLMIDVTVQQAKNADDQLDDICDLVETLMSQDEQLGGVCVDSILSTTEIIASDEGNQPTLTAKLKINVNYRTNWPDEITGAGALVDLNQVNTSIRAVNNGGGSPEIDSDLDLSS